MAHTKDCVHYAAPPVTEKALWEAKGVELFAFVPTSKITTLRNSAVTPIVQNKNVRLLNPGVT